MELGEKLQRLRKGEKWTQEELAKKLFVSRTAVSKWESGRGMPGMESLKAIAKLFGVSIDQLISEENLTALAETERREGARRMRSLAYGLLDCLAATLLFLPLLGQQEADRVAAVSLLRMTGEPGYIRIPQLLLVSLTVLLGVAVLALQNCMNDRWQRGTCGASLTVSGLAALVFILCQQPYAALFALAALAVKGALLLKRP